VTAVAPLAGQSKDKKKDPEQIGDRGVGKGINFYSLGEKLPSENRWHRK